MAKRKFSLVFSTKIVSEPITYKLIKDFDLLVNILRAEVTEAGGNLLIEVEGKPAQIIKGIEYMEERGVEVQELNEYVSKDDSRCTNCGTCVSICPADAISMNRETWVVTFNMDKCIACGLCISSCPPRAIKLKA